MNSGRLSDLVDQVTTKAHGRKSAECPYVGLENIEPGGRALTGTSPSSVSESMNGVFENGDILFGKLRPNLRKAVHVDFRGYCSTDFLVLRPRTGADQRYAGHVVASEAVFRHAERNSIGTGMPRTSWLAVSEASVWVPPMEEQRRIAEILDTIDETIQATERVIAKYERVIVGVLQTASLGFPRAEDPTFALSDFCSLSAGLTPSRSMSAYYGGDVPWVKSGEVAGSAILTTEETVSAKAVHHLGLRIVRSGTPLIAMYGATAGAVGWLEIDAATNQAVLAVEPEADRADHRWLYWALRLNSRRMLASIQGSGQPNLSKQIIGATKMSLPDLEEQVAEVERIDSAQASIEAQRAVATKLRRTRAGLAADLLSGRVRTVAA